MKGALKNAILLVAVVLFVCALLLEAMTRLFVDDGEWTYELEMWKYATDVKVRDLRRRDMGHRHGANRSTST